MNIKSKFINYEKFESKEAILFFKMKFFIFF